MLDFYADWCISCKEMEAYTYTDPRVLKKLEKVVLLQADVTANNEADKALLLAGEVEILNTNCLSSKLLLLRNSIII